MQTKKTRLESSWKQFALIFKNKKVWIGIGITIAFLILFRIGSLIPMPFLKLTNVGNSDPNSQTFADMMNLLGGGGLTQMSIFAIGISPYITAQIIMQLLSTDLIPPLARLVKSGERGRKKIEVYTRILTLPIAAIQAYSILALMKSGQNGISFEIISSSGITQDSPLFYFFYITLMLAGTFIAILFGDLITKKGVGNGMSVIILAGILATFFNSFQVAWKGLGGINGANANLVRIVSFIVYFLLYLVLLLTVIFINGSNRRIPIQQVGQSFSKDPRDITYLPIKLNTVGIIPVIFASSVMTIPSTVAQFLPTGSTGQTVINNYFSFNSISGIVIYFVLIILFTFFYAHVQLNPEKISTDLKNSGRFIPGVKVGKDTEKHIGRVIFRINWIGSPFLAIIACLPYIITLISMHASNGQVVIPSNAALGGTGIVIIVTATIEIWESIKSTSITTSYQYQRKQIDSKLMNNTTTEESKLW